MGRWRILSLEWDDPSEPRSPGQEIGEFLSKLWPGEVERRRISRRMVTKSQILSEIGHAVRGFEEGERILTVYGEDCHQNTYGLCRCVADLRSPGYLYCHFDLHPDDSPSLNGETIAIGNFVEEILSDTNATDVKFVANAVAPRIPSLGRVGDDAYLSIDLDFLGRTEVETRYAGGTWGREELMREVSAIISERKLISADCLGYYGRRDPQSHLIYALICALITGKDTGGFERLHDGAREGSLSFVQMHRELGLEPPCDSSERRA